MITAAEPCIFVADFDRAIDFYAGKLGFTLELAHGDPIHYGLIRRDAARMALRLVKTPVFAGDVREREQLLAVSLTLASSDDIEALHGACQSAGTVIFQRLRTEPWGARTFILRDPDGNLILFAAPAC